jgi:hypothetical protein
MAGTVSTCYIMPGGIAPDPMVPGVDLTISFDKSEDCTNVTVTLVEANGNRHPLTPAAGSVTVPAAFMKVGATFTIEFKCDCASATMTIEVEDF